MSNYRDKNDFDGSINGFCIGLKKGNTSYGYIIYNVEKYSVIEYCIQKNQENMYDSICSNQELENDSIDDIIAPFNPIISIGINNKLKVNLIL